MREKRDRKTCHWRSIISCDLTSGELCNNSFKSSPWNFFDENDSKETTENNYFSRMLCDSVVGWSYNLYCYFISFDSFQTQTKLKVFADWLVGFLFHKLIIVDFFSAEKAKVGVGNTTNDSQRDLHLWCAQNWSEIIFLRKSNNQNKFFTWLLF